MNPIVHRTSGLALLVALLACAWWPGAAPAQEGGARLLDRVIAIVNDDVITERELNRDLRIVKLQILQDSGRLPPDSALRPQVLERIIINRLQLQRAAQTGVQVDDLTLNTTLQRAAADNRMTLEQFRRAVEAEGEDFAVFRERMRDEITITRLQRQQVASLISVTEQEIEDFLVIEGDPMQKNIRYHLAQIMVEVPEAATPEIIAARSERAREIEARLQSGYDFQTLAITESDGQEALNGGDLGWFRASELPPLFGPIIRDMDVGEISKLIRSPAGFHLLKVLEVKGRQRHVVMQVHARHILIRTNEVVTDEAASGRLQALYTRIVQGDDFGELAVANSDDQGSAADGGDLGWVNPGDMVPRVAAKMKELPIGVVSEPFKSRFGWHVVEVLERREHDDTEEIRRDQARQIIAQRKAEEAVELWLRRLRDEAYLEFIDERDALKRS